MSIERNIKDAVKEKKLVIGSRSVFRAAKTGSLSGIIYAKNTPKNTLSDITYYASLSGLEIHEYSGNSMQLGELVGKPFSVLLIGILK